LAHPAGGLVISVDGVVRVVKDDDRSLRHLYNSNTSIRTLTTLCPHKSPSFTTL
jgi:hypothetical protein